MRHLRIAWMTGYGADGRQTGPSVPMGLTWVRADGTRRHAPDRGMDRAMRLHRLLTRRRR